MTVNFSTDQIQTICFDCAKALGYTPKDKTVGVWIDTCDKCKQLKPCTNLHHDWYKLETKRRNKMTNAEKYKTAEERIKAYASFCDNRRNCECCPAHTENAYPLCIFRWLELDADKEKLLPCPFCEGKAYVYTYLLYNVQAIRCAKCGASSGNYDTETEAIEAWNKRVPPKEEAK